MLLRRIRSGMLEMRYFQYLSIFSNMLGGSIGIL